MGGFAMWTLAQVRPNCDQIAKRNLERQGIATLCPLELRTFVRRGQFVNQLRLLFPGYIFCSIRDQATSWSAIDSTYGISSLVRFGQKPAVVPIEVIEQIRMSCDDDCVVKLHGDFQEGDEVAVTCGAFSNFVGRIISVSPNDRALLLLNLMGGDVPVNVERQYLRTLHGPVVTQEKL
ncbi:MAG: transcription termination/antitermination protein NusG [Erythrobacter sp.]